MIAVVGSANADWVFQVPRIPRLGETISASCFHTHAGGKGANQAVAAARLGSDVRFFGAVGSDAEGSWLLERIAAHGVDVSHVLRAGGLPTGRAMITVDPRGENAITILAGANAGVNEDYIASILPHVVESHVLMLQLEIPPSSIAFLLNRLPEGRPIVIFDPAPASPLDALPLPWNRVDLITPNETEVTELAATPEVETAADMLLERGVGTVLVTQGNRGACLYRRGHPPVHQEPPAVEAVDSTAAGDAFNGALAAVLDRDGIAGEALLDALRAGVCAGSSAASRPGAMASLPSAEDVTRLSTSLT